MLGLTAVEEARVSVLKSELKHLFDANMEKYGLQEDSLLFLNLLREMIDFSIKDSKKTPEDFKVILKYHFQEKGEKMYGVLFKVFVDIFQEYRDEDVSLVRIALLQLIGERLKPGEYKIIDGDLFIRRKRW